MMMGFRRFFLLLGISAGILASATSRTCSTRDFKYPRVRVPNDDSVTVTSRSTSSNFCGLSAKIKRKQRLSLRCTEFNLPDDFQMVVVSETTHVQVTSDALDHIFPCGDRMLLFSVSGPRDIDLTNAFSCEIISSPPPKCKCGIPNADEEPTNSEQRLVGGSIAPEGKYPWVVATAYTESSPLLCGGTLITSTKFITSWTCVVSVGQLAFIGEYDTSVDEDYAIVRKVTRVDNHPNFNSNTGENDIAIVTIDAPVPFSSKISPACLPETDRNYENETATAIGWRGNGLENGQTILNEADLPVKSCSSVGYPERDLILCAGDVTATTCDNDNGVGLLFRETPEDPYDLIGVANFDLGCDFPSKTGPFAKVSAHKSFILENVGGECELCDRP